MVRIAKHCRPIAALAGITLILSASAFAQDPRGTIGGRVVDRSDAVVVGAKVQITNEQTGVSATAQSNETGIFRVPFLPPGRYKVTAEMAGFKTYTQENIELRVADTLDLTLRLELGATSERITVTGGTPLLATEDATPATVLDERRLVELPEEGGDPFNLTRLVPGVVNERDLKTLKSSSPEGTSQMSVNGSGTDQTQFQIDGINDTVNDENKGYARVAFIPPSDAIVEFKMQLNPYDASAGHVLGPIVSVSTKSGTNQFHGALYDWVKNSAFDAVDFFVNAAGQKKPTYEDNRFGVSMGGPVVLPRLYNGHNKTFFFYAWEEDRWDGSSNGISTVPTAAERAGDFSALLKIGPQYQIYNPFTTVPIANGRYQRDPFPGNIIPSSLLDPLGLKLAAIYPLPNQPGTKDGQQNYFYPDVRHQQYDSHMGRLDHSFTDSNRLFLRLNHYKYTIPKNVLGIPATLFTEEQINEGVALDDVWVLSPSLVLNLRYGMTTASFPEQRGTQGASLTSLGFSPALANLSANPQLATIPRIADSPFTTLSNWSLGDGTTSGVSHDWVADLTKLKGSHSLHFGVDFRLLRTFAYRYQTAISPDLSFSTTYTRGPLDNSPSAPVGQQLAALLLGIPEGSMTTPATNSYAAQDTYAGFYVQDDLKVTPTLTLNLGLRYEMEWPVTERYDRLVAGFAAATPNPITAQAKANYAQHSIPEIPASAFNVLGGPTFVNPGGSPYNADNGHFLPRIGLGWQFTKNTVLRAGYGIYFGTLGVDSFQPVQTGFSQTTPIQPSLDNGVSYVATLANPFPNGLIPPSGAAGGLGTALGQSLQVFNPDQKLPYSQRWSLGIQRTLPGKFVLDVSYLGNRSTHLPVSQDLNATPAQYLSKSPFRDQTAINSLTQTFPNPFYGLNSVYTSTISRATLLQPYPEFGSVTMQQSMGYSWYHALVVQVEKRFSQGFTLQLAYTHSKYMQATEFLNPSDPAPYRVISDNDRPNLLTASGIWELPVGRGRHFGTNLAKPINAVIGDWQLDVVELHQSGAPLSWGNIIFLGDIKNIQLPDDQQSVNRWFNTGAGFNTSSSQQLANNIRTFPLRFSGIRSDAMTGYNASLIRNYRILERLSAQFRAEVYDLLNHPVFSTPNTTPTSSAFGTVTSDLAEPRGWQFALKLMF